MSNEATISQLEGQLAAATETLNRSQEQMRVLPPGPAAVNAAMVALNAAQARVDIHREIMGLGFGGQSAAKFRALMDLAEGVAGTRERAIDDLCHQIGVGHHTLYMWTRLGVADVHLDMVDQLTERYREVRDNVCPLPTGVGA